MIVRIRIRGGKHMEAPDRPEERRSKIMAIASEGEVSFDDVSSLFGKARAQHDLAVLLKEGRLERSAHGRYRAVSLNDRWTFELKLQHRAEEKQLLADYVVENYCRSGFLMLDAGSTCLAIARSLASL